MKIRAGCFYVVPLYRIRAEPLVKSIVKILPNGIFYSKLVPMAVAFQGTCQGLAGQGSPGAVLMPTLFGCILLCTNLCILCHLRILHKFVYLCTLAADSAAHTKRQMGNKPWSNFCLTSAAVEPLVHRSPARLVTVRGTAVYWVFGVSMDVISGIGNHN